MFNIKNIENTPHSHTHNDDDDTVLIIKFIAHHHTSSGACILTVFFFKGKKIEVSSYATNVFRLNDIKNDVRVHIY